MNLPFVQTASAVADYSPTRRPLALGSVACARDDQTMLRLTVLTAALTAGLMLAKGLYLPLADAWEPLGACAAIAALAAFYHWVRPAPNFVLTAKALGVMVAFSTAYSMLMYLLAMGGRPLADSMLASTDALLGLSAPDTVAWAAARPAIERLLWLAYFSLIPQTILAIAWLGLTNRRQNLDRFLVRFIQGSLITAVGFYFWPALGSYGEVYRLPVPAYCRTCVEHFEALRCGACEAITWRNTQGLITFPSFHTIWAVLLAAAFWRTPLFWPLAAWNALVVFSTVTTGMHYFTDVIAGLVITGVLLLDPAERKLAVEQHRVTI